MLTRLANLPITIKVIVAPLLLIASMVLLAVIFTSGIQRQSDALNHLYEDSVQTNKRIALLEKQSGAVQSNLYRLLSWKNSGIEADKIAELDRRVRADVAALKGSLDAIRPKGANAAESKSLESVRVTMTAFEGSVRSVLDMLSIDEASALVMMLSTEHEFDRLATSLAALVQEADQNTDLVFRNAQAVEDQTETNYYSVFAVFLLAGAAISLAMSRLIAGPVVRITGVMGRLAAGDTAIAIPSLDNRDEIGAVARAVEVFKDNMIRADRLTEERQAEQERHLRRADTLDALLRTFNTEVGAALEVVSSAATEMEATARSMTSTADETLREVNAVAAATDQTSANVQTVASAAEQLSSSIQEIGRQVDESHRVATTAHDEALAANSQINSLSETVARISDVAGLIHGIASQTNLLALNATIEAARAGEAGKGFAVVASEVKALANQTAQATDQITGQIDAVRTATGAAVSEINRIGSVIDQMNDIAAAVAAAIEEQTASTNEIASNVHQAATGVTEVARNVTHVRDSVRHTEEAGDAVLLAAQQLARAATALRTQVDGFLEKVRAA